MNSLPAAVVRQSREATNDCFEKILEGRVLPYDSNEMNAVVTY
jgi:cytochrome c